MNQKDYIDAVTGLLHCGICHTPKQKQLFLSSIGERMVNLLCQCQQEKQEREKRAREEREYFQRIQRLRIHGIHDPYLREWTFDNDNGKNPQISIMQEYVNQWEKVKRENIGLLLWGGVGTGKSFAAACIANALIEQNVQVMMTNFPKILSALQSLGFEDRNAYIESFNKYPLLIIDDLGVERGTEYALEQLFQVVDNRYKSGLPMIVTTNLHLDTLQEPGNIAYERIYSRILENCTPVCFAGENFRKEKAQEKMEKARQLLRKDGEYHA